MSPLAWHIQTQALLVAVPVTLTLASLQRLSTAKGIRSDLAADWEVGRVVTSVTTVCIAVLDALEREKSPR